MIFPNPGQFIINAIYELQYVKEYIEKMEKMDATFNSLTTLVIKIMSNHLK